MSYRPLCDMWILARAKLKDSKKYYGAYMGGFPERARALLGVSINDPVLHVCGGMAKHYPYKGGFGPNDKTLDLDPEVEPDILHDINKPLTEVIPFTDVIELSSVVLYRKYKEWKPKAYLCDPPYSEEDAEKYNVGAKNYPSPYKIICNCLDNLEVGQRVGIIHYMVPKKPKNTRFVACVGIICGFNNRIRVYTVFEKTLE